MPQQRPAASCEDLDLIYQAMCTMLHPHTCLTIKMASKQGAFVVIAIFGLVHHVDK
jgi:hypothetical protein